MQIPARLSSSLDANPSRSPSALLYLASQSLRRQTLLEQIDIPFRLLLADQSEDVEALEKAQPGEEALIYVQRVTHLKAQAALARLQRYQNYAAHLTQQSNELVPPGLPISAEMLPSTPYWPPLPILCADTIVSHQGQLLGKPQSEKEAQHMLRRLSGTTHQVLTAVSIALPPGLALPLPHLPPLSSSDPTPSPTFSLPSLSHLTHNSEKIHTIVSVSNVSLRTLTSAEINNYIASGEPYGKAGAYAIQGRAAKFIEFISGSYSGIMGLPLFETATLLRDVGIEK